MKASRRTFRAVVGIIAVIAIVGGGAAVDGQELRWQPVGATGDFTIIDNSATEGTPSEIILDAAGCHVTLELKVSGWGHAPGSPALGIYQATLDSTASYDNGIGATIGAYHPGTEDGCFIDETRPDFVYFGLEPLSAVLVGSPDYEMGSTCMGEFPSDPGAIQYGGTLILDLPAGAKSTYEIQIVDDTAKTFMNDDFANLIPGLVRTPGLVTIVTGQCCYNMGIENGCADGVTEAECDALTSPGHSYMFFAGAVCEDYSCDPCMGDSYCSDWSDCTMDVCEYNGYCYNYPIYNFITDCCDPNGGALTPIDDGLPCTVDICDEWTGEVSHNPLPAGEPCDDADFCTTESVCNGTGDPDACVGVMPEDQMIECVSDMECPAPWWCQRNMLDPMYGYCDCTSELNAVVMPWPPHDTVTNRYVSFALLNQYGAAACEVSLVSSTLFPASTGVVGWVGDPTEVASGEYVVRVVDTPVYREWPYSSVLLHLADCEITPAGVYQIRTTTDGLVFGSPLLRATVAEPTPKHWADVVGEFTGEVWTAADGVVGMNDVMAAIQGFQHSATAPVWTRVDVDGEEPNAIVNMTDVMQIVFGFQGQPYPFSDPADCP